MTDIDNYENSSTHPPTTFVPAGSVRKLNHGKPQRIQGRLGQGADARTRVTDSSGS